MPGAGVPLMPGPTAAQWPSIVADINPMPLYAGRGGPSQQPGYTGGVNWWQEGPRMGALGHYLNALGVNTEAGGRAIDQLNPLAMGQPYSNSPARERMNQSVGALTTMLGQGGMGASFTPGKPGHYAQAADIGQSAQGALALQEPERLQGLLKILLQAYGIPMETAGTWWSEEAAARNAKTQAMAGRQQALSNLPFNIGKVVA